MQTLELVYNARIDRGVIHQDYQRYFRYCSKRIRSLRKAALKKELSKKEILLFQAEKNWSFYMKLKYSSKRFALKRLKRAVETAAKLQSLCKSDQSKAYASHLRGLLEMEKKNFKVAISELKAASSIYSSIDSELASAALGSIEPNIRYCQYNMDLIEKNGSVELKATTKGTLFEWRFTQVVITSQKVAELVSLNDQFLESSQIVSQELLNAKAALAKIHTEQGEQSVAALELVYAYLMSEYSQNLIERYFELIESEIPANQAKLLQKIIDQLVILKSLPALNDQLSQSLLQGRICYYSAFKCLLLTEYYSKVSYKSSLVLKASEYLKTATLEANRLVVASQKKNAATKMPPNDIKQSIELQKLANDLNLKVEKACLKLKADIYLENLEIAQGLDDLSLIQSFAFDFPLKSDIKMDRICSLEPAVQPVAARPFLFDIAGNYVDYPLGNIERRSGGKQRVSVLSDSKQDKASLLGFVQGFWSK